MHSMHAASEGRRMRLEANRIEWVDREHGIFTERTEPLEGTVIGWHAYETEGHGYSWELVAETTPARAQFWMATIEPADGGGQTGRGNVLRYVNERQKTHAEAGVVMFHTFPEYLAAEGAE